MTTIEKIKQVLNKHFYIVENEDWYDADVIAEDLAKVIAVQNDVSGSLPSDTWKDIDRKWSESDMVNPTQDEVFKWLEKNYEVPKERGNYR